MDRKLMLYPVLCVSLGFALLSASTFKRYPVKSGIIFYDVSTESQMKGMHSKVNGIARLVFDDWGLRELKEEDVSEVQVGDFNETRERHSMNKFDSGTIYTVDFDEGTIYKTRDRSMDLSIAEGDDLSNETLDMLREMKARKIGEDEVSGYRCDLWKLKDQKICLYKGIPLKIVIEQPGFHSVKVALQIVLDGKVDPKQFQLPDFPIVIDEDYTSNDAAMKRTEDYIASIHDLRSKMKSLGISEENDSLTPQQEREVIDTLGARYLKKQKRLLPGLLVALEEAKGCISEAVSAREARNCLEEVNRIDVELGDRTENFDLRDFDEKKREMVESSLESEIRYLKVTNECVQKYDRTSEVIVCTEGNLGEEEMQ